MDYEDKSDEFECRNLEESQVYQKDLPAPPTSNKTRTGVVISIEVANIGQIDEIKSAVDFQYSLHLKCFEGRLNYLNLKDTSENKLKYLEIESLWVPTVVFYNTESELKNVVSGIDTSMTIERD